MMRKQSSKIISLVAVFILFILLVACKDKEENTTGKTDGKEAVEEKVDSEEEESTAANQNNEDDSEESEDVSFEVKDSKAPKDQGELNVWFKGDVEVVDHTITVKGTTNLMPESQLSLDISPEEGSIIGGDGQTKVENSGAFEIEANVPGDFEGLLHVELSFEANAQYDDAIVDHYKDGITGNFARVYYDSYEEATFTKASFQKTVVINGESESFAITEPKWRIPDDIGNPAVWINSKVEKFQDYVVVNIESNLVEGTYINATADIPNYITTGFSGSAYTNPDGTAVLYIEDPAKDSRIKDLSEYEIEIEVDPSNGNNGKQVLEVYGEAGEKLKGDLVYNTDDGKAISQRLTIEVE
ncbi:hypothetical protein [Ornithinibacillus xuwenensis]|uniref:Lipoprotein n=1 Tax=Ornithinibacillus xuwenensis TaxID=3144668 RepID=A0ABU9XPT8_9BACI